MAKSSRAAASGAFIFINPFLGTVCQLATQLQLPAPAARCSMLPSLSLSFCTLLLSFLSLCSLPAAPVVAAADVSLSQISDAAVAAFCSLCLFYLPLHANAYIYHTYTHYRCVCVCVLGHCCCCYSGLSLRQVCHVTINCFVFNFVWMWGARLWLRLLINKARQSRKEKGVQ